MAPLDEIKDTEHCNLTFSPKTIERGVTPELSGSQCGTLR